MHIDPEAIRHRVSASLHSLDRMSGTEAYYRVDSVLDEIGDILDEAQKLIEADDPRNALIMLQAITEAYLAEWEILDGSSGATGEFFEDIASVWVDALASADLSQEERAVWTERATKWQVQLANEGIDDAFEDVVTAARDGTK